MEAYVLFFVTSQNVARACLELLCDKSHRVDLECGSIQISASPIGNLVQAVQMLSFFIHHCVCRLPHVDVD